MLTIEEKDISKYSIEELEEIIKFWWFHYGKMMLTLKEIQEFEQLLKTNLDDILTVAVIALINNRSSEELVRAMREDRVEELFLRARKTKQSLVTMKKYAPIEKRFIKMVLRDYRNTVPSTPITDEQIQRQLSDIIGSNKKFRIKKIKL